VSTEQLRLEVFGVRAAVVDHPVTGAPLCPPPPLSGAPTAVC
jgi:hypothetical protein